MMVSRAFVVLVAVGVFILCCCTEAFASVVVVVKPADLILINGRIWADSTSGHQWVEALSVRDGNILSLGHKKAVLAEQGAQTVIIDLKKRVVLPGFTNGHLPLTIEADYKQNLLKLMADAANYGFTTVQGVFDEKTLHALEGLARDDKLTLRFDVWGILEKPEEYLALERKFSSSSASEYVRFDGLYAALDGAVKDRTAALLSPYHGHPQETGELKYTQDQLNKLVLVANKQGIPVTLHAAGDYAVNRAISAYGFVRKNLFNSRTRNRIVDAEVVSSTVYKRFYDLNVSVVMNVEQFQAGSVHHLKYENYLGPTRVQEVGPLKSLQDVGAVIALSAPTFHNPFESLQGALKPLKSQQALSLERALEAFTLGPAFAAHTDHMKGSIREGKEADLVVVEPDPFQGSHRAKNTSVVVMTIVNGRVVFDQQKQ